METIYPTQKVRQNASFMERPRTLLNKIFMKKNSRDFWKRTDGQNFGRRFVGTVDVHMWVYLNLTLARVLLATPLPYSAFFFLVIIY